MKPTLRTLLSAVCFFTATSAATAHPSSGIVVNDQGEVFFVHSGRGLAKIDREGKLSYVHSSTGGHWLCLDREGRFSRTQPKHFLRVTPDGVRPAILFADGGAPIAVGRDGNLYFASNWRSGEAHPPGGLTVSRNSPDGTLSHLSPALQAALLKLDEGVTGLAAGVDGWLYVASPGSIFKVTTNGAVSVLARPGAVKGCDENLPPNWRAPGFRGLDVATNGTVFAAATGCRAVVKISPDGTVETVLKSEPPWSPTCVALQNGTLYVLEWTNPNGDRDDGWRPRVRKLAPDGTVTTLVTITENASGPPAR